jgi:2-polyprenyl-3-methyl-5-hydroxy-6-metoxy-1,4-benzoquinol methylase
MEMESVKYCVACKSEELTVLGPAKVRRAFVTGDDEMKVRYGVMACNQCGLIFLNPRMDGITLQKYYSKQSRMPRKTMDHASPTYRFMCMQAELIGRYKALKENDNVLEIGCSEGYFLRVLSEACEFPLNIYGVEPSDKYVEQATENVKSLHLQSTTLEEAELLSSSFDLIVIRHVLEHLPSPVDALKIMQDLLNEDGVIYIEVPDIATVVPSISNFFHHEHLSYFTVETLTSSLARAGLAPLHIERFHGNPQGSGFSYPVLRAVITRDVDTVPEDVPNQYEAIWKKWNEANKVFRDECLDSVSEKLDQYTKEGSKIAVFGAGPHTMDLFERFEEKAYKWAVIFDNNPNKHGKTMMGVPIVKPERDALVHADCILISTAEFEKEILEQLNELNLMNTEIIPIYQSLAHLVEQ